MFSSTKSNLVNQNIQTLVRFLCFEKLLQPGNESKELTSKIYSRYLDKLFIKKLVL